MALVGKSEERLEGVHPDVVRVVTEVSKFWDVNVLEGTRDFERQRQLYAAKKSRTLESKHLLQSDGLSHAIDAAPDPVDWRDINRFYYFGGVMLATARALGVKLRWGGDWNGNTQIKDQKFNDLVHFELIP